MAYINSDSTGKGWLGVDGSHSLQAFVNEVMRDVPDPRSGTAQDVFEAKRAIARSSRRPTERREERHPARGTISRSTRSDPGSDYTAFLDHLTIASLNLGFGGEQPTAASTTPSTTRSTGTRTSPTATSHYGAALSRTIGTAILRLADADILPFEFTDTRRRCAATSTRSTRNARSIVDAPAAGSDDRAGCPHEAGSRRWRI